MLIEFRVLNYRSIGEEQVLSFVPAPKQQEYKENISTQGKYEALNALALYGANASGKSNILKAIGQLDRLVGTSARLSSKAKLPYDPFLLREGWDSKPTKFEVTFIEDSVRYRYGLTYTQDAVKSEWLFRKAEGKEVSLFKRDGDTIEIGHGFEGHKKIVDAAIETTRNNTLFLSVADTFNLEDAKLVFNWFWKLRPIDGLNVEGFQSVELLEDREYAEKIEEYLTALDLGILGIDLESEDFNESNLPKEMPKKLKSELAKRFSADKIITVKALHRFYDTDGKPTIDTRSWDWGQRESSGSIKALELSGPVLWALVNGGVLIIDEIEAKLHPIMTLKIIELFLDTATNPKRTQLVFATHDSNLLSHSKLRRDQIYFAEKNEWESTELYSLSDFIYHTDKDGVSSTKKERPDSDKETRYLEGRYGAVPALGNFSSVIRQFKWQNEGA